IDQCRGRLKFAFENSRQLLEVNVAARDHTHNLPKAIIFPGERRSDSRCAGTLCNHPVSLSERAHRIGDVCKRHHQRAVEKTLRKRPHFVENPARSNSVDKASLVIDSYWPASSECCCKC